MDVPSADTTPLREQSPSSTWRDKDVWIAWGSREVTDGTMLAGKVVVVTGRVLVVDLGEAGQR
jgi:hypothetical protein